MILGVFVILALCVLIVIKRIDYRRESDYFYENKDFYRKVMKVEDQNSFSNHFRDIVGPVMAEDIKEILGDQTNTDFYVNFWNDAIICAFGRWISERNPVPPKEFVKLLKSCIKVIIKTQERLDA